MQRADGAVYHKVTPLNFGGFDKNSDNIGGQLFVFDASTPDAAVFAAITAEAARVYRRTIDAAIDDRDDDGRQLALGARQSARRVHHRMKQRRALFQRIDGLLHLSIPGAANSRRRLSPGGRPQGPWKSRH